VDIIVDNAAVNWASNDAINYYQTKTPFLLQESGGQMVIPALFHRAQAKAHVVDYG